MVSASSAETYPRKVAARKALGDLESIRGAAREAAFGPAARPFREPGRERDHTGERPRPAGEAWPWLPSRHSTPNN
jgi:hypothetical protein